MAGFPDALNLRDFGGWRGDGGRPIKKEVVYRSGRLSWLDDVTRDHLAQLRLKTILDLRSDEEATAHPDPPLPGARIVHVDAKRGDVGDQLSEHATFDELVAAKVHASVDMAFGSEALRMMFSLLAEPGSTPLLIHCNSGKDRTGVASIVLLMALGASDETIMLDYLLSNAYRAAEIAWSQTLVDGFAELPHDIQQLYTIMQGVIPHTCQAILDEIDARYPSRAAYLAAECGVGAAELQALRSRLLG